MSEPTPRRFILLRLGYCHLKNARGFKLLCQAVQAEHMETANIQEAAAIPCDILWIPFSYVPPMAFPSAKRIVYGPHNFVFPFGGWMKLDMCADPRVYYNCLSDWNKKVTARCLEGTSANYPLCTLPFPVDTEDFRPKTIEKSLDCFIYFKNRRPEHLDIVLETLRKLSLDLGRGLSYVVLKYGSYKEEDYKNVLAAARYGIWVGRHESQGFALEEALSCNVPLVVWDAAKMGDEWNESVGRPEYGEEEGAHAATSIPYWSGECGLVVKEASELLTAVRVMNVLYTTYCPRDFVLRELSPRACAARWLEASAPSKIGPA